MAGTGRQLTVTRIVVLAVAAVAIAPAVPPALPPWYPGPPCFVYTFENASVGSTLFRINATSDPSLSDRNITFGMSSSQTEKLVNLSAPYLSTQDIWSADVILLVPLDRDYEPATRTLYFTASDTNGNTSPLSCILTILDVNDNPPSFQGLPYDVSVAENTSVGTLLALTITATDPDGGLFGFVSVRAVFPDDTNETFVTANPIGSGAMNTSLKSPLDFETRNFYSFLAVAEDGGGLNATAVVRVTVTDVQDTPPFFLLDSYRAAVLENQAVGTSIIRVSAEDGDRNPRNDIRYSIVEGNTEYFAIDSVTGVVFSLVELDRDNDTMVGKDAIFELVIQANETDTVKPQLGNTTQEVVLSVVVVDDNDNAPTFGSSTPYTAFLREDVANNSLVYFEGDGYIFVSDADQGQNSHFNLTVERNGVPWPALAPTPVDVYMEALVLLRVKDSAAIREAAGTHINIQLVAREASTPQRFSSTAAVVVTVEALPEPTTTPAPSDSYSVTAPDIVVFVIGFLVVLNIVTSVLIICFMRNRSQQQRKGQAKRGAKYYVSSTCSLESGDAGSAVHSNGFGQLDRKGSANRSPYEVFLEDTHVANKQGEAKKEAGKQFKVQGSLSSRAGVERKVQSVEQSRDAAPAAENGGAVLSDHGTGTQSASAATTATATNTTTAAPDAVAFVSPLAAPSTSGPAESDLEPVTKFSTSGMISTSLEAKSGLRDSLALSSGSPAMHGKDTSPLIRY